MKKKSENSTDEIRRKAIDDINNAIDLIEKRYPFEIEFNFNVKIKNGN